MTTRSGRVERVVGAVHDRQSVEAAGPVFALDVSDAASWTAIAVPALILCRIQHLELALVFETLLMRRPLENLFVIDASFFEFEELNMGPFIQLDNSKSFSKFCYKAWNKIVGEEKNTYFLFLYCIINQKNIYTHNCNVKACFFCSLMTHSTTSLARRK